MWKVTDSKLATPNVTEYHYDGFGNLDYFTYPNGVKHDFDYTEQNRLKHLVLSRSDGSVLRDFTYELNAAGHRTAVVEAEGAGAGTVPRRRVTWEYDRDSVSGAALARVYRLTHESVLDGAGNAVANITHQYDAVGNRTAALPEALPAQYFTYNSRDQIDGSLYDANGNTVTETGSSSVDLYDTENHLIKRDSNIRIDYDHEGNRISKTVSSVVTYYLLDDRNPSGYVQVLAEYSELSSPPSRAYTYGQALIAQRRNTGTAASPAWTTSYYGYDGQGSVRLLTGATTAADITDTYDYDAYGVLIDNPTDHPTPNNYRYTGQQWDNDLGMYYLRARYFNQQTGRFWTMDTYEGVSEDPATLHKYSYCRGNPVDRVDPSGLCDFSFGSLLSAMGIDTIVESRDAAASAAAKRYVQRSVENYENLFSMTDLTRNEQMGKSAEVLWARRLGQLGIKAVSLPPAINARGPDMIGFGQAGGKFRIFLAEVKGMSQSRLLSALERNVDGSLQMSSDWIDKNLSGIANNLIKTIEDLIGAEIPGGGDAVRKGFTSLKEGGEIEFYLLRGVRYSGRGWQLRGFRLLHVGGSDVGLAGSSQIPGIEEYYPKAAPFLSDP